MGWTNNPYYNPEVFGLRVIAEIEWYEPCYSFDTTVVWKHDASGKYYFASDSGCSCPSPFEDYDELDDISSGSMHDAIDYINSERRPGSSSESYWEPQWVRATELILASRY